MAEEAQEVAAKAAVKAGPEGSGPEGMKGAEGPGAATEEVGEEG